MKSLLLLLLSTLGSGLASAENPIVASPETAFDRQVLDTVLGRGLDEIWDINANANRFNPGLPVAIHFSEWGAPVELGQAVQQRGINQPFELVVGFYEKLPNSTEATVVAVHDIKVDATLWQRLWGKITPQELKQLQDSFQTGPDKGAYFYASGEAARIRLKGAVIQVQPQIKDNKREILCYVPFAIFHTQFLNDPVPKKQQGLTLWGQPFKSTIDLGTKRPQTVVAAIDRNGKPVTPKVNSGNPASPANAKKTMEAPAEVKPTKLVLKDENRIGSAAVNENPASKATPEEIEAAIQAAQQGKLTPATAGVVDETPTPPPPPVDTGWQRIDIEPVKIK